MKVAELYLRCLGCRRIPNWTKVTQTTNEKEQIVKHYEFNGLCPYCNGSKFEVVEARSAKECQEPSASSAIGAVDLEQKA